MRAKQAVAIVASIAIVLAAYVAWYKATQSFNPSPGTVALDTGASCSPSAPPCPAFGIDSANLTLKTAEDITSQELALTLTAGGPSDINRLSVFFSGVPIGNLTRTVVPGQSTTAAWAIPTTLNVTIGRSYLIYVSAQYLSPGGGVAAEYWNSIQVVAV
ncbi:MAG TPA: hypothetical protein VEC02_02040 [Nitrososphaerales archaeon]|nr:hypothetical protein [Nitrososphaerales archaeon]